MFINEGYDYQAVSSPLLLFGLLAALLAIFGISSKLRDQTPTVAKVTAGIASIAIIAVVVLIVWGIAEEMGVLSTSPMMLALIALVSFILSFTLAGVMVIQSDIYQRLVGYLLIGEAIMLVLVFAIPVLVYQGTTPEEVTIGIELAQAILLLWAGSLIRDTTELENREASVKADV